MYKIIIGIKIIFTALLIYGLDGLFTYLDVVQAQYAVNQMGNGNTTFIVDMMTKAKSCDVLIYALIIILVFSYDVVNYLLKEKNND